MAFKRGVDVIVSAGLLLVLAPVLLLAGAAVWLETGWPVLYSQTRIGRDFRRFRMWKFRSMKNGSQGLRVTVSGDPRITRVGHFLRAAKLDELPQLWNVLRGDMSLVGPRPELPEYVEAFRSRYVRILTIRPGITDLASVRFRDEEAVLAGSPHPVRDYLERVLPVKLDLAEEYLRKCSWRLDLSILAQTLRVTLRVG